MTEHTEAAKTEKAAPICTTIIDAKAGTLTMRFTDAGDVVLTHGELSESAVEDLTVELALVGAARVLTNAYSAVRKEGAAKAFEVTQARKLSLLAEGIAQRNEGTGSTQTALETAIDVVGEVTGRGSEAVRAIVMAYKDKHVHDAKTNTSVLHSAEDQRDAFVAKVKADPTTAGIYAAKRAAQRAPKSKPSFLNEFGG